MKKSSRIGLILVFAFCFSLLLSPSYRVRAQAAWEILFNGKMSKTEVLETESGPMVPVYFAIPEEGEMATYGVRLERDFDSQKVKIVKVKKKGPMRERGDCPKCDGAKSCQDCYPTGSGVHTSGGECYTCNGSGECSYCEGSGDCYTCDGNGFPTGCNTCGDVSE